jgi:hypothetical protein
MRYVSNHNFCDFSANIGACFSQEADKIITQSISLKIAESKSVSSQNIAFIQEKIISAVTIAFPEPAIRGFLNFEKSHFFISTVWNNSKAASTHSSSEMRLFSVNVFVCSKYFICKYFI